MTQKEELVISIASELVAWVKKLDAMHCNSFLDDDFGRLFTELEQAVDGLDAA